MRNKNVWILVAAAVVLFVAAYLLSRGSADVPIVADAGPAKTAAVKRAPVVYPRDLAKASPSPPAKPAPAEAQRLDELQRALLPPGGKGAIFVEANAIRHSPLMEKILKCREKASNDGGLNDLKDKLGIDPMEDVDRVGFDGDVFVASGFFQKMHVPPELGDGAAYGDGGHIWHTSDDRGDEIFFGKLGDGMLLTGANEAQVKAAMDRAQDASASTSQLPPGFGEGEVYGTVGKEFLQSMLGDSKDPTAQTIAKLVTSSTVRMNVDEDAALSLDLKAVDDGSAKDLSSAMKGVFASLHAKAEQEGDQDLAQLLEQARVSDPDVGGFSVDVAVPGETLLRGMGCGPDGTPIEGARRNPRAPSKNDDAPAPPPASPPSPGEPAQRAP